jgi:hypothetical protein
MSTGQSNLTPSEIPLEYPSAGPRRAPGGVVQHILPRNLVVRRRDLGDLEKTPATTSLAPGLRPLHLRTAKTTQRAVAGEKRTT